MRRRIFFLEPIFIFQFKISLHAENTDTLFYAAKGFCPHLTADASDFWGDLCPLVAVDIKGPNVVINQDVEIIK